MSNSIFGMIDRDIKNGADPVYAMLHPGCTQKPTSGAMHLMGVYRPMSDAEKERMDRERLMREATRKVQESCWPIAPLPLEMPRAPVFLDIPETPNFAWPASCHTPSSYGGTA